MLLEEKDGNLFIFFCIPFLLFSNPFLSSQSSLRAVCIQQFIVDVIKATLFFFLCCRKYIGQIFTDSLVHDAKALKYLVDTIGQVNIAYNFTFDSRK